MAVKRAPRCVRQRCDRRGELTDRNGGLLCISHAEQAADEAFQAYVRQRDRGCTAIGVLRSLACEGPTQAAHIVGRANHAVRYDPANVWGLCRAHHVFVDQTGRENAKYTWAVSRLGWSGYQDLMTRAMASVGRREAVSAVLTRDWVQDPQDWVIGAGRPLHGDSR